VIGNLKGGLGLAAAAAQAGSQPQQLASASDSELEDSDGLGIRARSRHGPDSPPEDSGRLGGGGHGLRFPRWAGPQPDEHPPPVFVPGAFGAGLFRAGRLALDARLQAATLADAGGRPGPPHIVVNAAREW
jgi:hypothetical protein